MTSPPRSFHPSPSEIAMRALQRAIDELESLGSLDAFMPRVLSIVSEAFGAVACLHFDHGAARVIRLRQAFVRGQVLSTPDWPDLDAEQSAFVAQLFAGFPAPPIELLGMDAYERTASAINDHRTGHAWPEAHAWVLSMGWGLELNVPLLVAGTVRGALAIFRPGDQPWTIEDIALAESLAKQVAIAMQVLRVAQREREIVLLTERNRLAADIHDSLAQSLTAIALQSEVLASRLPPGSVDRSTAERIEQTARRGLAEARASVQALRSLPETEDALGSALHDLAEYCSIRGSIEATFQKDPGPCPLDADAQEAVLRVAQEAATNAMKHARCKTLRLYLAWDADAVYLTVRDDGCGFALGASLLRNGSGGGYGVPGMHERATRSGGRLRILSAPNEGTTVELRLPRAAASASETP